MGASLLITFRESLEASLVIGIVFALMGEERRRLSGAVWAGLVAGLAGSFALAVAFVQLLGSFDGVEEQIFEGTAMAVGALLLATLVLWSGSHSSGRKLEGEVEKAAGRGWFAIWSLVFVSVLREGVETVIYLGSSLKDGGPGTFVGGLAGIAAAVLLGFLILRGERRIPTSRFFVITTGLLLLFGAGLFSRAAGEFGEAGLVPPLVEPLWRLVPGGATGLQAAFADDGSLGSFLKGLFGYSSAPSLSQLLAWLVYMAAVPGALLVRASFGRKARAGQR